MEIQTETKMKDVLNFLRQGNPFEAQKIIIFGKSNEIRTCGNIFKQIRFK